MNLYETKEKWNSLRPLVAQAIRNRRKALKMTQEELCLRTGLTRCAITNIELGNQGVTLVSLYAIAEALQCTEAWALLPNMQDAREPYKESAELLIEIAACIKEGNLEHARMLANRVLKNPSP